MNDMGKKVTAEQLIRTKTMIDLGINNKSICREVGISQGALGVYKRIFNAVETGEPISENPNSFCQAAVKEYCEKTGRHMPENIYPNKVQKTEQKNGIPVTQRQESRMKEPRYTLMITFDNLSDNETKAVINDVIGLPVIEHLQFRISKYEQDEEGR